MTSAMDGDPSKAMSSVPAAAATKRDGVILSSLYIDGRIERHCPR
jgi:hypothetical protein